MNAEAAMNTRPLPFGWRWWTGVAFMPDGDRYTFDIPARTFEEAEAAAFELLPNGRLVGDLSVFDEDETDDDLDLA
jgi:hypothetical protein